MGTRGATRHDGKKKKSGMFSLPCLFQTWVTPTSQKKLPTLGATNSMGLLAKKILINARPKRTWRHIAYRPSSSRSTLCYSRRAIPFYPPSLLLRKALEWTISHLQPSPCFVCRGAFFSLVLHAPARPSRHKISEQACSKG